MAGFNTELGLKTGDDGDSIVLETRPEHEVIPGTIHFAVLTTLGEVSAAQAVAAPVVPTNVNVSLLRRAVPGRLIGRGTVIKRGRRLSFAEGEIFQDDKIVAKVNVQFAMM